MLIYAIVVLVIKDSNFITQKPLLCIYLPNNLLNIEINASIWS